MGNNVFTISDEAKEQLYAEFAKQFTQEQADKKARAPLPVEITTELDNVVSERQRKENFQRFRSDCEKYALDERSTPQNESTVDYIKISANIKPSPQMLSQQFTSSQIQ